MLRQDKNEGFKELKSEKRMISVKAINNYFQKKEKIGFKLIHKDKIDYLRMDIFERERLLDKAGKDIKGLKADI